MRGRFSRNFAVVLIAGTAACTTPHHTNALIFGTNTNFGITAGQDATGIPSVVIGYRRQEAVFMPLVANARYDANGVPQPCNITPGGVTAASMNDPSLTLERFPARGESGQFVLRDIPPCFLVGQHDNAIDTYSVLASFGADFAGSARSTDPNASASGGIAQFFATGLAAQALAVRGGSSLVAVSEASRAAAAADTDAALSALYGDAAVSRRVVEITQTGALSQNDVLTYLRAHTTDENFTQELRDLESAANQPGALSYLLCDGLERQACIDAIAAPAGLRSLTFNGGAWSTAVQQRKTARGIQ